MVSRILHQVSKLSLLLPEVQKSLTYFAVVCLFNNCSALILLSGSCCANLQDVKGKVAVVIGASTGLGRGVADRLALGGMRVRKIG